VSVAFVALATCKELPEPDYDEPLLVGALEAAGVPARVLAWDDESVDWTAPSLTVIRSTWNYYLRPAAFLAWAERQGERLVNSASVVAWNHHKRYLRELAGEGFAVVPTVWLREKSRGPFAPLFAERGWSDVVVKPAISAGSYRTSRLAGPRFDEEVIAALVSKGDAMAQPYIQSVEDYGERSLVYIDGEITHAVRKAPRLSGQKEQVSDAVAIADDERRLATTLLGRRDIVGSPLYARVDMVRDEQGRPMLSEVELIEPSLFLAQHPGATDRLVGAIAERFRAVGAS
jgi:hypothetical protein